MLVAEDASCLAGANHQHRQPADNCGAANHAGQVRAERTDFLIFFPLQSTYVFFFFLGSLREGEQQNQLTMQAQQHQLLAAQNMLANSTEQVCRRMLTYATRVC